MQRFYFNIYNDDIMLDDEGSLLADDHAARAHTVKAVRGPAAETVLLGHFVGCRRVEYVDAAQNVIGTVRFDEAVVVTYEKEACSVSHI